MMRVSCRDRRRPALTAILRVRVRDILILAWGWGLRWVRQRPVELVRRGVARCAAQRLSGSYSSILYWEQPEWTVDDGRCLPSRVLDDQTCGTLRALLPRLQGVSLLVVHGHAAHGARRRHGKRKRWWRRQRRLWCCGHELFTFESKMIGVLTAFLHPRVAWIFPCLA